jgi:hypothetical protein
MLMRDSFGRSLLSSFRLNRLMPAQTDTQSQIARKVNFAIQLLRQASELLEVETPQTVFSTKRSRYPHRRTRESRDE